MAQISDTSKGIILIISSAFCFALMAVFVRLAGDIFFMQKAFFRNAVAFLVALVSILFESFESKENKNIFSAFGKTTLFFLVLRSVAGTIGIFGNFYAVDHLILSDAAILNKMAPFFTILFSFILLNEKVKLVPLMAIFFAFLGAMLVVKPSFDFSKMIPTLSGFLGGLGAGFAYTCVRKLSTLGCKGKIVVLFFSGFSMLASLPYMIFNFNPMTLSQTLCLVMAGICAAGGQFTITAAYFHAPAGKISIYDYSQIIFSAVFGLLIFGQLPDALSFIGYLVIISMATVNFFFNKRNSTPPQA
ncbi:DMT family transporter [Treponema zioleckii]|uniref:DMT family transporter n=1 Tax=Treponema zioleckii TaxID=331680 RepID=UPI00168A6C2E|nr:DMT family transporter [Treponema zioleckii]